LKWQPDAPTGRPKRSGQQNSLRAVRRFQRMLYCRLVWSGARGRPKPAVARSVAVLGTLACCRKLLFAFEGLCG